MSAFGSGHDLRVLGSSPTSGSLLDRKPLLPLPLPLLVFLLSLSLSVKKKNKNLKKKKKIQIKLCNYTSYKISTALREQPNPYNGSNTLPDWDLAML